MSPHHVVQIDYAEYERVKAIVAAAVKFVDADLAWENNPSKFPQDHVKGAEATRVAREALRDEVLKRRHAKGSR